MDNETLAERIKGICKDLGTPEPLHFLAEVMAGKDPRRVSEVFRYAKRLHEEYGTEIPPIEEYRELMSLILSQPEAQPITIEHSHAAAKQIIEYTHPKKKQIEQEVTGTMLPGEIRELTKAEIRKYKRVFGRKYGGRK